MPAPAKLPANHILVALRREGLSYRRIAETYGTSTSAVYLRLQQAGATTRRPDHSQYLPWTLNTNAGHHHTTEAAYLRALSRIDQGIAQPGDAKAHAARRWARGIIRRGEVVTYDRERGFGFAARRDSDGDALVRL